MVSATVPRLEKLASSMRLAAGVARVIASLIIGLGLFLPSPARMPGIGLDQSWAFGMNQAIAQRLSFGDQIIFTYGPYSSIYTLIYHPATARMMVVGSVYLAISCGVAVGTILHGGKWPWLLLLCAAVMAWPTDPDATLFFVPLLAGLAAWSLGSLPRDLSGRGSFIRSIHAAILFAPLGLVPLIKGSALMLSLTVIALSATMFVVRDRGRLALVSIASAMMSLLIAWIAAGQRLSTVASYLKRELQFSVGYVEAMSGGSADVNEVWWYLAGSLVLLAAIAGSGRLSTSAKLFAVSLYGLVLFVAFKAGFVRHDTHALIASGTLVLCALLVPALLDAKLAWPVILTALSISIFIDSHYLHLSPNTLSSVFRARSLSLQSYVTSWGQTRAAYRRQFYDTLDRFRRDVALPSVSGTTDIYPFEQCYLFASGNRWWPRPVFQSYAAFSPELAALNSRHLAGPTPPDNIFFRVGSIDDRVPSLDDGPSWPELLTRYELREFRDPYLVLAHRADASDANTHALEHSIGTLGRRVAVPAADRPLFVKIHLLPTFMGRFANLVFKSDPVWIGLQLSDGSTRRYRLIPGMAEAGFILSPFIETTEEFGMLYGADHLLADKRVRTLTIETTAAGSMQKWRSQYEVSFTEVETGTGADLASLINLRRFGEADEAVGSSKCDGHIDVINGSSPAQTTFLTSRLLRISGWLAESITSGLVPESIYVVLTDSQGQRRYARAQSTPRPDVAAFFRQPRLVGSGFSLTAELPGLPGPYTINLAMRQAHQILVCSGHELELTAAVRPLAKVDR